MRKTVLIIIALCLSSLVIDAQPQAFYDNLSRAESLFGAQKYREAQHEYSTARLSADRSSLPYIDLRIALCSAELGDGREALKSFLTTYPAAYNRSEALFALGREHFEAEEWSEVTEVLKKVDIGQLSDDRMNEYRFMAGYSNYKTGNSVEAEKHLTKLDRNNMYYPHAQYALGYMAYSSGDNSSAENYFASIADYPAYGNVVPYYLLSIAFSRGNYDYVTANCERVLGTIKGSRSVEVLRIAAESNFMLRRWVQAENYMARYAEAGGTMGRDENYMAGYAMYRAADYTKAIGYLRGACGADDRLTQNAAYHLADCYLKSGDRKNAMQSFSMAYTGGGDPAIREDALYNYCKLQVEQGEGHFNEEIRILRQYLTDYPSSPKRSEIEGYFISACYAAKNLRGAYEALSEFASLGDNVRRAIQQIAYYYAVECVAGDRLDDAEDYCTISLDYAGYDSNIEALATFLLGEIDYRNGKFVSAAAMFEQYVNLKRRNQKEYPFAFYNMGYARFNASKFDAAYDDFTDFTEIYTANDSYRADALNRLGDIKAAGKEYDKAVKFYSLSAATKTDERFYGAYNAALMEGMAGHTQRRIDALRRILADGKGEYLVRANYELGQTLVTAGDYGEAARVLEDYTARYAKSPDYVAALADLGLAYRNLGKDDEALKNYKKVIATSRGTVAAQNALSEIMNICIDRNEVDKYFEYAASVGMNGEAGAMQRDSLTFVAAQKLYIAGEKERAAKAFDDYLKANPEGAYAAAALYYGSDCNAAVGDNQAALEKLQRLTGMYHNSYTQRAYEKTAAISAASSDFATAAEAYRKLSTAAATPKRRREALESYLQTIVRSGDNNAVITAAGEVAASPDATPEIIRKAQFAKAKALQANGKPNPAVAIFSALSTDVSTPEGAESAYIIIETAYQFGSRDKAEELIYEFSAKNTPHAYWLAKAFLRLGDIYVARNDTFQARATYQSIVDGYANPDDGIVQEARERIADLK